MKSSSYNRVPPSERRGKLLLERSKTSVPEVCMNYAIAHFHLRCAVPSGAYLVEFLTTGQNGNWGGGTKHSRVVTFRVLEKATSIA